MKNLHKNIGIFATSLLAASSAVYIYSPVIGSHADSSATADINLAVGEVMNLTLDTNSLDLNTTPNNFVSGVINATASTNSQYGYTLTLEDVDDNTNLVHTNENIDAVVSSNFSGSKTSSEMEANTWGFSLNATDFYKVPVNGSPVALKRTTTPMTAANETTPVTFGAKVGNLTSGTYTDKVLFTMYVNGQDGKPSGTDDPSNPGEEGSTTPTMQNFSCANLENVGDTTTLTDSRDSHTYTIKKLDDEQCWMMGALKIANKTLTSNDSDLASGSTFELPASELTENMYLNGEFPYNITVFDTNKMMNSNDVYVDENYGGYYSWYTATAGEGTIDLAKNTAVSQSICPKGWRLPTQYDVGYLGARFGISNQGFDQPGHSIQNVVSEQGERGYYWTNTADEDAHSIVLYTASYSPQSQSRQSGLSVKCIAR